MSKSDETASHMGDDSGGKRATGPARAVESNRERNRMSRNGEPPVDATAIEAAKGEGRRASRRVAQPAAPRRHTPPTPADLANAADLGDDGRIVPRRR